MKKKSFPCGTWLAFLISFGMLVVFFPAYRPLAVGIAVTGFVWFFVLLIVRLFIRMKGRKR